MNTLSNNDLISYIVAYRLFKINKDKAIQSMIEINKRKELGDKFNFEEEINIRENILSSIGNGFVVKIIDGINIDSILFEIRKLNIKSMILDKNKRFIHIGIASINDQEIISKLIGVKEIIPDKKVLENVISSKLS